jgi:hypothetical protein
MNSETSQRQVVDTIRGTAFNCMRNLTYTRHPSKTMWGLIDDFHKSFGHHPTFEQFKGFNDKNKGINCFLYVEAAVDLLRS